jgi:hypothetical protein
MRKAFALAGLLQEPDDSFLTEEDKRSQLDRQARALFKRWFREQHYFQPLTQRPMMRIAREARALLLSFFVDKEIPFADYPLVLWKDLRADFAEQEKQALQSQRDRLIDALLGDATDTTDVDDRTQLDHSKLRKGEDQHWDLHLKRHREQSEASFDEQTKTLEALMESVNAVVDKSACFVPSPIIIGPPGAGKTHLMKLGVLYALSRGLNVSMMALTGEFYSYIMLCC